MATQFLSIQQAADLLSITRQQAWRLARQPGNPLKAALVGKSYVLDKRAVQARADNPPRVGRPALPQSAE